MILSLERGFPWCRLIGKASYLLLILFFLFVGVNTLDHFVSALTSLRGLFEFF